MVSRSVYGYFAEHHEHAMSSMSCRSLMSTDPGVVAAILFLKLQVRGPLEMQREEGAFGSDDNDLITKLEWR